MGRRSKRCLSICFWKRTRSRPSRSFSTSTPPTIRCTGTRKAASFTAITTATAICRCTSSAVRICWRPNSGPPTSTPQPARSRRWRADAGFAREALMRWCETNGVDFLFGLAKNKRLVGEIAGELAAAEEDGKASGQPARRFKESQWSTRDSWSRQRRVVAKAEWTRGAANPRFVVTSLSPEDAAPQQLYEEIYCARGDMENRIKECQLDLFADRTSAATMRANQLRLWFASMAYVLLCALRRLALPHTQFAKATCGTIRLKLLKIGALVRTSVRRITLAMASSYPYQRDFALAHAQLTNATAR